MKARLSIKTLTASLLLAFATAFTLNACSSGDDCTGDECGNGGNNNGGGISNGTGSFSGLQAWIDDTKYTGNGDIKIKAGCDEDWKNCDYINAGKIESGFVKLQLPSSIDDKYLKTLDKANIVPNDLPPSCNVPADVKALMVRGVDGFYIPDIGSLLLEYEHDESVWYLYSSKAANNISCNFGDDKLGDVSLSLNLEKGWNEVYTAEKGSYYISTDKSVLDHLNNIKWVISDKD